MTKGRACQHEARDQRIRDPVHGLITFRKSVELEQLAWALLDAPEFQRYWDADARRMTEAVRRIGKVE